VRQCEDCAGEGERPTWTDKPMEQPRHEWLTCPTCLGKGILAEKGDRTVPAARARREMDPELAVPATVPDEAEKVSRHRKRVVVKG